jgi:hypothetical protein
MLPARSANQTLFMKKALRAGALKWNGEISIRSDKWYFPDPVLCESGELKPFLNKLALAYNHPGSAFCLLITSCFETERLGQSLIGQ